MLKTAPAVFAVGNEYQIMVQVTRESMFWVKVGDKCYYDESNGILRSLSKHHRASVPMAELDKARKYTVCVHPLIERKPYYTETEPVQEFEFEFHPVPLEGTVRAYHISDAHNRIVEPLRAARTFGDIDFLILNGDVIDHSGDPSKFSNIYEICSELTGGHVPTIFSRGNHDMRGNYAERFAEYTPNQLGRTYYTFRLGRIWGILMDCGEDKPDGGIEYGGTICCHVFRQRQTEYIKDVIARAAEEYESEGVQERLVISHHPFTHKLEPPFDIEEDTYALWAKLIKENIKPDLMMCGHTHINEIRPIGHERDNFGQPCTLVVAAGKKADVITGTGFEFKENEIKVTFTNSNAEILEKNVIKK
jgi:predicted phosphodiesterase